jgi:lipopolysaccharide biosynthesis glycosyltransferase
MGIGTIEIFFVASGDYAPFVAITALTIIENTHELVRFHVLTENFKEKDKRVLERFFSSYPNVSIEFIDVEQKLKAFGSAQLCWFKSYIPYARVLIPELTSLPKVIYMDVDIIVNCDIKELWDIDFCRDGKEYPLAASMDGQLQMPNNYLDYHRIHVLNLSADHVYFNNGLLVLNLDKWREENITNKLLNLALTSKMKFTYPTQDLFNIVFENNYIEFDISYNSMPMFVKPSKSYSPKCLHFAMIKPHLVKCHKSELFWKYAGKTPYYKRLIYIRKLRKNKVEMKNASKKKLQQQEGRMTSKDSPII